MPQPLKDLFDRVLDDEPEPPGGDLARQVMAQGRGIRRRRAVLVGGTVAAVVAVAVGVNFAAAPAGPPPPRVSAVAVAMMAQIEPQCTWTVSDRATDVGIFLRSDITGRQRGALQDALHADPLVRDLDFESREQAYERFKVLWRDSPDFVASVGVSSLPESFRLRLGRPEQYPEFAAKYAGRPGVQDLIGGRCP